MHKLIAFVGQGGAGKTTLIAELVARYPERLIIIPSLTTRSSRGTAQDAIDYRHVSHEEMWRCKRSGGLLQMVTHAGHLYADSKWMAEDILRRSVGIKALTEQGVLNWRAEGFDVVAIRIVPYGHTDTRPPERIKDDAEREALLPTPDFTVVNYHMKGGLQGPIFMIKSFLLDSVF